MISYSIKMFYIDILLHKNKVTKQDQDYALQFYRMQMTDDYSTYFRYIWMFK